jgi:mannose-1-phosphate guanylyltransferase
MNVMLLAAGLGTRFKPVTFKYPKPAIPFLNVPMGLYQFQYLKHLEISKLVVNTYHIPEKIEHLYKSQPYYKKEVFFSHETEKILGGAGGLKKAYPLMKKGEPILLMNADEVYFTQEKDFLKKALQRHVSNKNLSTVVVTAHPEAGKKFGALWADSKHSVKDISKSAQHGHLKPWHCIGPIFLSPEVLDLIPEGAESNIFYDVLLKKLNTETVEVFPIEAHWYETGNPKDFFEATNDVLKNLDAETLSFINQYDPSMIYKNSQTLSLVSKSANVDPTQLHGTNIISKSAVVEKNKMVKDSVIFDHEVLNSDYFKS